MNHVDGMESNDDQQIESRHRITTAATFVENNIDDKLSRRC
jgi:hypothetical protein